MGVRRKGGTDAVVGPVMMGEETHSRSHSRSCLIETDYPPLGASAYDSSYGSSILHSYYESHHSLLRILPFLPFWVEKGAGIGLECAIRSFSFWWGGCKGYVEGLRAPLGLTAGVARFVGIGLGEAVRGGVVGLGNILPCGGDEESLG